MGCEDLQREVWGGVETNDGEGGKRVRVVDGGDG
jgi:hypothetical protein